MAYKSNVFASTTFIFRFVVNKIGGIGKILVTSMEIFVKTIFFLVFSAIRVVHCGIRESFSLVPLQFKFYGIAPEYIDPAPKELCQVRWANGAIANLGNTLTASDIDKPPTVYWSCDKREKYSVFLIDLDPLGMDTRLGSESRLWLVANITNCNWDHAETVFDYLPPTPIEGTGPHRYVVLVYKQPATLFYEEPFERSEWVCLVIEMFAHFSDLIYPSISVWLIIGSTHRWKKTLSNMALDGQSAAISSLARGMNKYREQLHRWSNRSRLTFTEVYMVQDFSANSHSILATT